MYHILWIRSWKNGFSFAQMKINSRLLRLPATEINNFNDMKWNRYVKRKCWYSHCGSNGSNIRVQAKTINDILRTKDDHNFLVLSKIIPKIVSSIAIELVHTACNENETNPVKLIAFFPRWVSHATCGVLPTSTAIWTTNSGWKCLRKEMHKQIA